MPRIRSPHALLVLPAVAAAVGPCGGPSEAEFGVDFEAACEGTGVSNAAAYREAGPNPAFVLLEGPTGSLAQNSSSGPPGKRFFALKPEEGAVVACGSVAKEGRALRTCKLKEQGESVEVQVRGVTFDVKVHEASTGKKLGQGRLEATRTGARSSPCSRRMTPPCTRIQPTRTSWRYLEPYVRP